MGPPDSITDWMLHGQIPSECGAELPPRLWIRRSSPPWSFASDLILYAGCAINSTVIRCAVVHLCVGKSICASPLFFWQLIAVAIGCFVFFCICVCSLNAHVLHGAMRPRGILWPTPAVWPHLARIWEQLCARRPLAWGLAAFVCKTHLCLGSQVASL